MQIEGKVSKCREGTVGQGGGGRGGSACNIVLELTPRIFLSRYAGDSLPAGSEPFRLHGHGLGAAGGHLPHMPTEYNCFYLQGIASRP